MHNLIKHKLEFWAGKLSTYEMWDGTRNQDNDYSQGVTNGKITLARELLEDLKKPDITGILHNWRRDQGYNKEFVIWGNIYSDQKGRWVDGTLIHTSGIKNRELKEGDIINTRNSIYKLGKPYEDSNIESYPKTEDGVNQRADSNNETVC